MDALVLFGSLAGLIFLIWLLSLISSYLKAHDLINWETFWKFFDTGGLWAAAAVGVWAIVSSTDDAREQRNTMSQALTATIRPWMQPRGILINNFFISEEDDAKDTVLASANINVEYSNVGHSPALAVTVHASMTSHEEGTDPSDAAKRCLLDSLKTRLSIDKLASDNQIVFAGQNDTLTTEVQAEDKFDPKIQRLDEIYFVKGCITYVFQGSDTLHHTFFAGTITHKPPPDDPSGFAPINVLPPRMIDPQELKATFESSETLAD